VSCCKAARRYKARLFESTGDLQNGASVSFACLHLEFWSLASVANADFKTLTSWNRIERAQSRRVSAGAASKLPLVTSTKRLRQRATCSCHLQHACEPWRQRSGCRRSAGVEVGCYWCVLTAPGHPVAGGGVSCGDLRPVGPARCPRDLWRQRSRSG
jgi:hypothetical protein